MTKRSFFKSLLAAAAISPALCKLAKWAQPEPIEAALIQRWYVYCPIGTDRWVKLAEQLWPK